MRFSKSQFATFEEREAGRVIEASLASFEEDTRPVDPVLADEIARYQASEDKQVFKRIVRLTDQGAYQRTLLAMSLQSGVDFTTDENFNYIFGHPALSGNTKARHLILMMVALQGLGE